MPRYRSTSPFSQDLLGLSVGVGGVAVFPADGRPDLPEGSTVTLAPGDELECPEPVEFPGALRLDPPPDAPPADPASPPSPEETPA